MISLEKYGYANQNQKESSFQWPLRDTVYGYCKGCGRIGLNVFTLGFV